MTIAAKNRSVKSLWMSPMAYQAMITATSSTEASMLRAAKRTHLLATGPDGRGAKKGVVTYPHGGG